MSQEKIIWEVVIFGSILLVSLGTVIIIVLFLYQRKRYRHRQEMIKMQETFSREILHSKNEIQEQTLQHIATEIHDNFSPTLSVINLNLAGVIPNIQDPSKETIIDTKVLVKQLMAEMKTLSSSLNTDQISRIGFEKALEKYVEQLKKTGFYVIDFVKTGLQYRLTANKEIILLRMCQEILNNIVKHANAKHISILINYGIDSYSVEIRDDGDGFEESLLNTSSDKQDSTGLRNLRNRAQVIEAALIIDSRPGQGTTILINLPKQDRP